jgi:hypothetical protein
MISSSETVAIMDVDLSSWRSHLQVGAEASANGADVRGALRDEPDHVVVVVRAGLVGVERRRLAA